ncbi:thiamine pyrophosphate-dependent dehydrogenase E1 component subunit alpha [Natrarchaeobaculum sulfurireducens]|uniref:Acetoin dehydrogenase E1 component alpha-subunit n=1 Tax=Natrarchaeobaculum sulfurireducens TaxID=2044521 RepID=A0A346PFV1_9EURY|nr:thiamine pyrophosphate-dependent dehydrogenase E1 component subunit alpha [Natrarchaeobaculum sulfurireducens]AXR78396.1 Pyruvate/2-oxoglutarate/acetoin dehydrogenase complex, dehydrogenase (E1) component, alpha subunit [Natrarchaeobaculum sulfurireducens]AXR81577.1 Acetoin dehydrogenase E1 component alpha-subunit [Natrarchaeobaculum sulfurireducens]
MADYDLQGETGRRDALRRMVTIRAFDEEAGNRFADGEIPGFVHLYIGEEAVGVGTCAALEPDDYIASTHRGHGHCIAKGLDPKYMMAELYGKADGYCNGKGGSMHIADVDAGMLGANGIVGAGPPMATGAALSIDYQDRDQVAVGFLGDGAVAQGQVHEAVNIAATWDLPAIFVIENNHYGEGTPVEDQHNVDTLSDTAQAYDIPGVTVDGMDITAVEEAVAKARERARAGDGPSIIEAETYRYRGHYEGDEEPYRDDAEIERWMDRDPIETFRDRLIDRGELTEDEFEELQAEVDAEIDAAVEFALDADDPTPEQAYEDMFAEMPPEIDRFAAAARTDGGERSHDSRPSSAHRSDGGHPGGDRR